MIAVRGVLLDPAEAAYVVKGLELLAKVLPANGSQPSPRLLAVTAELARRTKAASDGSVAVDTPNARGSGSCAPGPPEPPQDQRHATVGTSEAARILGVSPSAVRQLAARGRLLGSERPAGRWVHSAAAVVARAERTAAQRNRG